jgi:hypothetical protein
VLAAVLAWLSHNHAQEVDVPALPPSPIFSPFDSPSYSARQRRRDARPKAAISSQAVAAPTVCSQSESERAAERLLGRVRLSLVPADFLAALVEGVLPHALLLEAYRDQALLRGRRQQRSGTCSQALPAHAAAAVAAAAALQPEGDASWGARRRVAAAQALWTPPPPSHAPADEGDCSEVLKRTDNPYSTPPKKLLF